jgi:hypothetical protein
MRTTATRAYSRHVIEDEEQTTILSIGPRAIAGAGGGPAAAGKKIVKSAI